MADSDTDPFRVNPIPLGPPARGIMGGGIVEELQELGFPPPPPPPPDELPPGYGGNVLPHIATFQAITNLVARTYTGMWDEARKDAWKNSVIMRNDPIIMDALRSRQVPLTQLGWHIEPDNANKRKERRMAKEAEKTLKNTPGLQHIRMQLAEAIWQGRYGVQTACHWDFARGRRRLMFGDFRTIDGGHIPINGDKIVFRFGGQPCILVHGAYPGPRIYTDLGIAHPLTPREKEQVVIHIFEPEDADFYEGDHAGRRFGVGVRSRIYYWWWQRNILWKWSSDFMQTIGTGGLTIYYYEEGNPASFAAAQSAASLQASNRAILIGVKPGTRDLQRVERVEPSEAGAEFLYRMITEYYNATIRQYILMEQLTSTTGDSGHLGGGGVADVHAKTASQRTRYDAIPLQETLTTQWLWIHQRYTWPEMPPERAPLRLVFEVDQPEPEKWMAGATAFFQMGGKIPAQEAASILGISQPKPGEEVLSQEAVQKLQQATQPTGPGMPGEQLPGTEEGTSGGLENLLGGAPSDDGGSDATGGSDQGQPPAPLPDDGGGAVEPEKRGAVAKRLRLSKDAAGHEHKGAGEGGGQFVSTGEGGYAGTVHHGSPHHDLSVVSAAPPTRQFDNATSVFGAFFAPDESGAEKYAGKSGKLYKAKLHLRKPYEMPWREFAHYQDPTKDDEGEKIPPEKWEDRIEELKRKALAKRKELEDAGHDGVIVKTPRGTLFEISSFKDVPLIRHAKKVAAPTGGKLDRISLGFVSPPEGRDVPDFGQCSACVSFDGKRLCRKFGPHDAVKPGGSCDLFVYGVPQQMGDEEFEGASAAESGYVERQVRCGNCRSAREGATRCGLYAMLNQAQPETFQLDETITPQSCCNLQRGKTSEKPVRREKADRSAHVPTVAVDLDGTLAEYDGWRGEDHFGSVRPGALDALNTLRDRGCRIIIFTTRGATNKVRKWLEENGLPFDYINENPDQPPGSSSKPIADLYLDDRAVDASKSWSAVLAEALTRLQPKPTRRAKVAGSRWRDTRPESAPGLARPAASPSVAGGQTPSTAEAPPRRQAKTARVRPRADVLAYILRTNVPGRIRTDQMTEQEWSRKYLPDPEYVLLTVHPEALRQPSVEPHQHKVERYEEMNPRTMPAVVVATRPRHDEPWVADGSHRVEVARRRGTEKIKAWVATRWAKAVQEASERLWQEASA